MMQPANSRRLIRVARNIALAVAVLVVWFVFTTPEQITDCRAVGEIRPVCIFKRPEDLAALPGDRYIVVSQMGDFLSGKEAGSLALFDQMTEDVTQLYPLPQVSQSPSAEQSRTEDNCTEPGPGLSPHGIHLSPLSEKRFRLLVVNHGGRESVEFFNLVNTASVAAPDWKLTWERCIIAPEGAFLNDVAATPEGGFVVSHMFDQDRAWWSLMSAVVFKRPTGHVWQWHPDEGFAVVAGSHGAFPNGVELSADGRYLFVNHYAAGKVLKVERASGRVLAEVVVGAPDNSTWSRDGHLLVATHSWSLLAMFRGCGDSDQEPCSGAFEIVAIDPVSFESRVVFAHQGAPMGTATVALDTQFGLWMGSYIGDRMIRIPPLKKLNSKVLPD